MASGGIDPILYSKYHHLQEKEVNDFLLASAATLDWGNLTRKVVMDIGCGPGNTSCSWFLSLFPAVKRLIAIDISEGMINLGKTLNPHPKIEYMVADITDESSVECWEGTINKAISTWCLQFVPDQEKALKNIYKILKPGGAAAILFEADSPYHHFYQDISRSEKWNAFFKNVGQERIKELSKNSDDSPYKQLLQDLGFKVILCKRKQRSFTFSTDDDCIGFLLSTFPEHKMIPENLMDEFRKDLLQSVLSYGSKEPNGRPTVNYNVMNVLIRKPNSPN